MLNYYYWYAVIWIAILSIYSLSWSQINTKLHPVLILFFVITIWMSVLLGRKNNKQLRFFPMQIRPQKSQYVTLFIILYFVIEFYIYGGIPIIEYLFMHNRGYTSFTGSKSIFTVLFTFSLYYAIYLYYAHVSFSKITKEYLLQAMLILTFIFCTGNRGAILMSIFCIVIIYLSSKKLSIFDGAKILIFALIILYLFGAVGNLREGGKSFCDDTYITAIGEYQDYPSYLPGAYKWAYSYLTSPLNNLNYNISHSNININNFMLTFLPDFISKRIAPDFTLKTGVKLVKPYFNVSTGYAQAVVFGGVVGLFMMYSFLMIFSLVIRKIFLSSQQHYIPSLAIINMLIVFFFFINTITYSGISFQLFYPFIFSLVFRARKKKLFNVRR